jgi:transcriptional regulator with XRE-family HTH domain
MRGDGKTFGQRLREARIRAGLSQSDLEEISGIPKARLSRYENGHVSPSIHTLERLARALGVSEASLLGDERAALEGFFAALDARGIRIDSPERAARVANALADLVEALRGSEPGGLGGERIDEQAAATVESVERWLAEGGDRLSD